jgi:flagellar biosynthetic protein FliR
VSDPVGFLMAAGVFGSKHLAAFLVVNMSFGNLIPVRILAALALAFGALAAPPALPGFVESVVLLAGFVASGVALALVVSSALWGAQAAGEYLANAVGLGFAALPAANGLPQLAVFFQRATAALFFGGGGFVALLGALTRVDAGPPGLAATLDRAVEAGAAAWVDAVVIAVPAGAVILAVNLVAGIAAKAAPQLGILSVGLPAAAIAGIAALWLTWPGSVPRIADAVLR